ncbi:MAG TPA: hypothetical protein VGS18_03680 [Thermoplasmata archaeon]|nr:hypothetical protein [Thermoplasmata archaeon]
MGRVIHVRVWGLDPEDREAFHGRFRRLADLREWRGDVPWLADAGSRDLFSMEFFRHAQISSEAAALTLGPLSAAGFVRLRGDETDALALLFVLRDLSERFGTTITIRDPDNPIAKLRSVDLCGGRLQDGAALEAILVARPIFKRLPGAVIEMYPPRALGVAFGTVEGGDPERRAWSFLVHGMRASAESFLEAEAEAMRIYRGLRFLR